MKIIIALSILLCSCTSKNAESVATNPHKVECGEVDRHRHDFSLYRCENKEVVCYVSSWGGVDCFLKPKDSESKDRKE